MACDNEKKIYKTFQNLYLENFVREFLLIF